MRNLSREVLEVPLQEATAMKQKYTQGMFNKAYITLSQAWVYFSIFSVLVFDHQFWKITEFLNASYFFCLLSIRLSFCLEFMLQRFLLKNGLALKAHQACCEFRRGVGQIEAGDLLEKISLSLISPFSRTNEYFLDWHFSEHSLGLTSLDLS